MLYRPINDLHREFDRWYFQTHMKKNPDQWNIYFPSKLDTDKDTVLGIAGDIDSKKFQIKFLIDIASQFKAVVCVFGNHDYWRRDFTNHSNILKQQLKDAGVSNVHILDRDSVVIDGVRFIGATLWTDFGKGDNLSMFIAEQEIRDFHVMRKENYKRRVKSFDLLKTHIEDKNFIFSFAQNNEKMVVLSHHAPSFQSVDFNRYGFGPINNAYATELGNEISYSNFALWHHGHIHASKDYMIYETRVICNPRGYFNVSENKTFNDQMLIEL